MTAQRSQHRRGHVRLTTGQRARGDKPTPVQRMAGRLFDGLPLLGRWTTAGAACLGVIGAVVGLVVGLFTYAPTAPFAAFEVGLPAVIVGGVVGLVAGATVLAVRRIKREPW